jgi:hypothetical protein
MVSTNLYKALRIELVFTVQVLLRSFYLKSHTLFRELQLLWALALETLDRNPTNKPCVRGTLENACCERRDLSNFSNLMSL